MANPIPENKEKAGISYCIIAQTLWGVSVLFWPLLSYLNPVTILSLRMVISFVFAVFVIFLTKRLFHIKNLLSDKKSLRNLILASFILPVNWGVYIYTINTGQAIETSLGYYITPIISITLGRFIFHDILNKNQAIAIILVVIGVGAGIVSYGTIPYYALILGFSFAIYSFLHKVINADAISILCIETGLVSPFACLWLIFAEPGYALLNYPPVHYLLLGCTVFFTGIPLMLFSYAAIYVRLTTIGFLMYISPSINFLLAIFYTGEMVKPSDYVTFPIVWLALAIYTFDMFCKHKRIIKK